MSRLKKAKKVMKVFSTLAGHYVKKNTKRISKTGSAYVSQICAGEVILRVLMQ